MRHSRPVTRVHSRDFPKGGVSPRDRRFGDRRHRLGGRVVGDAMRATVPLACLAVVIVAPFMCVAMIYRLAVELLVQLREVGGGDD